MPLQDLEKGPIRPPRTRTTPPGHPLKSANVFSLRGYQNFEGKLWGAVAEVPGTVEEEPLVTVKNQSLPEVVG